MKLVDDRLRRVGLDRAARCCSCRRSLTAGPPARLDDPVDDPIRMGLAQRRHRRQRVQNVAHGAQPDHKQAKLGLRVQTLIFSQALAKRSRLQVAHQTVDGLILAINLDAQPDGFERQDSREARSERTQPDQILLRCEHCNG